MKIAYSYGRFSTLAQGESGKDSERRQIASAKRWCTSNGYSLSDQRFFDKGKSGYKGENMAEGGDLLKFITLVESGQIPKGCPLLIDTTDRFTRMKPSKSLALFLRVINAGIGLVFPGSYEQRIIDTALVDNEPHIVQFIIGDLIRGYTESKEKSRKIVEALRANKAKMQAGEIIPHNNLPKYFSYDEKAGEYVHNANTVIVKDLIQAILLGKTLYFLANDLNARKVKTFRRGFEWSGNSIRAILRNRTLIGEFLGNENFVPAITDEETFNKVQVILNNNRKYRGQRGNVINIFKGMAFCSDCGRAMSTASQTCDGITYRYLKCPMGGLGKSTSCKNKKLIRLDQMEKDFFTHFLNKHPYELIKDDERAELKAANKEIADKQLKLAKLTRDVNAAVEMFGAIKMPEFKAKMIKLEAERDKTKTELDSLNLKVSMIQGTPKTARPVLLTVTNFEGNEDGTDKETIVFADTQEKIEEALKDNAAREQTRLLLPALIGKVTVNTAKAQFHVFTRMGKLIFESHPQQSNRNRSERWKQSLKQWTTRRITGGRVITVKRKTK